MLLFIFLKACFTKNDLDKCININFSSFPKIIFVHYEYFRKFLSGWNKEYHGHVISTPSTCSEDPVFKLEGRNFTLSLFIVFSSLFRQMSGWCTHLVTVSSCHTISTLLFLLLDVMQFEIPKSSLNDGSGLNRVAFIQVERAGCLCRCDYYAKSLKTMSLPVCPPPRTDFIQSLKSFGPPTQ